jgi:hypothetical protein
VTTTVTTAMATTGSTTVADTGSVSTSDDGDDSFDDGCAFIRHCSDNSLPPFECDVWAQDCPEGDKCTAWANDGGTSWNATKCAPVDRLPAAPGEPCTVEGNAVSGIDDCALGSMCWDVDPQTNEATCVALCSGSEPAPICSDGSACYIGFGGSINLCLPQCNPLMDTCPVGQSCLHLAVGGQLVCFPDEPFTAQPAGQPCAADEPCEQGLACVDAVHVPGCTGGRCCTPVGSQADPPTCPAPEQQCIDGDDLMSPYDLCFCGVP